MELVGGEEEKKIIVCPKHLFFSLPNGKNNRRCFLFYGVGWSQLSTPAKNNQKKNAYDRKKTIFFFSFPSGTFNDSLSIFPNGKKKIIA